MQAVYYRDRLGSEPVRAFLDILPVAEQDAIGWAIELLNRLQPSDPPLPFPHSSQVEGELRELRCHYGRKHYRVLYCRSDTLFILLHILEKRTGAIPRGDIEIAMSRWNNFKARMDTDHREPPRAAGHDAP
jgi:phage-related protein